METIAYIVVSIFWIVFGLSTLILALLSYIISLERKNNGKRKILSYLISLGMAIAQDLIFLLIFIATKSNVEYGILCLIIIFGLPIVSNLVLTKFGSMRLRHYSVLNFGKFL